MARRRSSIAPRPPIPNPGRTETFHRLNRSEYQNAIRDLLSIDVNIADLLPADDSSYGFDNIAGVLRISPALMERYLSAAKTISRLAVGAPLPAVDHEVYRVVPDAQQHDHVDGLPLGTRGGLGVRHLFPLDGEYDIKVDVTGAAAHPRTAATGGHDRRRAGRGCSRWPAAPAPGSSVYDSEDKLVARVPVPAGPRDVGVAFVKKPALLRRAGARALPESAHLRERRRSWRVDAGGHERDGDRAVSIRRAPGNTPSRRRIFVCQPGERRPGKRAARGKSCPRSRAGRFAARCPTTRCPTCSQFYAEGRAESGTFDAGIEFALRGCS